MRQQIEQKLLGRFAAIAVASLSFRFSRILRRRIFFPLTLVAAAAFTQPAHADVFDFNGTLIAGVYPDFTFTEATLGTVTVVYTAPNHPLAVNPLVDIYGGVDSLMMGGLVDISWQNPITSLDLRLYDLDLREFATFTLETGVVLSTPGQLNGAMLDIGTNTINATAADLGNGNSNNYTEIRLNGDTFTSFSLLQRRPTGLNGASGLGFGNAVLPTVGGGGNQTGGGATTVDAPETLSLLGLGLVAMRAARRRRRCSPLN